MTGFRTAERRKAHLRLGIAGPSGSGKTASALLLAYGLSGDWRKIGLVDTENGSGELYVGATIGSTKIGEYQVLTLTAPYEPGKYIQAIREAEQAGLEVVIVDSLSHAWAGEGGLLDQHGKIADRGGNSFAAWRQVTPMHNQLVEAMLQSGIHVIATLRSKTEYVVAADEKGKSTPKKIGLAPVQREGMEYEFTVFLDLDQKHVAYASKDRTNLLDGRYLTPTVETGLTLKAWLEQGTEGNAEAPEAPSTESDRPISSEQVDVLVRLARELGVANRTVSGMIQSRYGKSSSLALTSVQAEDLRRHLASMQSAKEAQ